jgi:hypothetical protein
MSEAIAKQFAESNGRALTVKPNYKPSVKVKVKHMDNTNQPQSETVIPLKDIETALDSLRAVRAKMTFLSALTPKERQSMPRMNPVVLGTMEAVVAAAQENPGILPASLSLHQYATEVEACRALHNVLTQLQELSSGVQDTLLTLGREANGTTQQVRAIVNTAARTKPTPGLKLLSRRLNPRPGRYVKAEAETPAPASAPVAPLTVDPASTAAPPSSVAQTPAPTPGSEPKAA